MLFLRFFSLRPFLPVMGGLLLLLPQTAPAQESCTAASGEEQHPTGSITWTVGQMAYLESRGINGSQIQGVQQPYELQFLPGIDDPYGSSPPLFILYPNPVSDECWLKITAQEPAGHHMEVHDLQGNRIRQVDIHRDETRISLGTLASGTYIVSIWKSSACLQKSKLIKR
jgi:hypothetical protein